MISSEEGGSEDDDGDGEDKPESSRSKVQSNQDLSEDEFRQLIVDFATWYDGLRYLGMLKVLYKDIVDDNQTLERATNVTELLSHLVGPAQLNRTNLTLLYDTVKITKQSGFKSRIKEKLYHFKNIDKVHVTSFTKHRINILNFGKVLTDANINTFDTICNFPGLKQYKDSWSLITDLEKQGKLKEDNVEAFRQILRQNGMDSAEKCFIHYGEEMSPVSQIPSQRFSYQDEAMNSTESGRQKRDKDDIIREYLLKHQRQFCIKTNESAPEFKKSLFKGDMANMFTDLDLMKVNQTGPSPIQLDELSSLIKSTPACKVFINGEGGIGKTTLLRYLSYRWANETDHTFQGKILFVVDVRDMEAGEDILDVIVKRIKLKHFSLKTGLPENSRMIERFLLNHDNEIVLLLDGLEDLKIGVNDPIGLFKGEELENCVVILTSRSENIDQYIKESDVHVKVKGFNGENINKYITKHFSYLGASYLGESLNTELDRKRYRPIRHREVRLMCRNPRLLLLVCGMWEENTYLPTEKSVLFEEIFRSVLNQYNTDEKNGQKIEEFKDTPNQLVDAMLVLGRGLYEGLTLNQLYVNKKKLKGSNDMVTLALQLGFVYKDLPNSRYGFEETFTAPHKLLVEALVGFYFYKVSLQTGESQHSTMKETRNTETDLLPNECEWDSLIDNDHLKVAREFAIGFLGSKADTFLNHWITNSLTTYRSLITHLSIVKEEHRVDVVNALSAHPSMTHLSIKPNIDRVRVSLMKCVHHMIQDVSEDYKFIELLRNIRGVGPVFSEPLQACFAETDTIIKVICNESSSEEKGIMLAHIMIAVPDQDKLLRRVSETCDDNVIEHLNLECKKLNFKYDINNFSLKKCSVTPSLLIHLLCNSPKLKTLRLDESVTSKVVNEMSKDITSVGCKLPLKELVIIGCSLSSIDSSLLASFLILNPTLKVMSMVRCSISGEIINNIIKKCCSSGQKLLLEKLDISDNVLNNLDGSSLASLMVVAPKLEVLDMHNCRLSGQVFNDMAKSFSGKVSLELKKLILYDNNLSTIKGTSLAYIMTIASKLQHFKISSCHLSGGIINAIANDLSRRQMQITNVMPVQHCNNVQMDLMYLNLSGNNLSTINGTLLASLLGSVYQVLFLDISFCRLSGHILNDMMEKLIKTTNQFKLRDLNINGNCLTNVTGYSMASMFTTFSELDTLTVEESGLSGVIINDMVSQCVDNKVSLKLKGLDLSGNNLSEISGCSLALLFAISPELKVLNMRKCNLSGAVIDNMIIECIDRRVTAKLNILLMSTNNLKHVNPSQLISLVDIAPKLEYFNLYNCALPNDIKQIISSKFSRRGVYVDVKKEITNNKTMNIVFQNSKTIPFVVSSSPSKGMLIVQPSRLTMYYQGTIE
ncbi:uncharacterized protein [Antedon mediterranea]|uniref:uncharacterized protein isoform X2 n=1 Tax=Antedon mediterranea TaxID=105859 RepID=UPI003AF44B90